MNSLKFMEFDTYGKRWITGVAGCSPDSFVQLAIMGAYAMLYGGQFPAAPGRGGGGGLEQWWGGRSSRRSHRAPAAQNLPRPTKQS